MAFYDDEDEHGIGLLDQDEEQKRSLLHQSGAMSVSSPYESSTPQSIAGSTPPPQPAQRHYNKLPGGGYQLAPLSEGDGKTPQSILGPSESTQPATSITAGPLEKPAAATPLGPAAQREHDLLGQGPPQYHGAKKVLDILGRATRPGQAIEQGTGLGTMGYETRLGQAHADSAREQSLAKGPLDLEQEQAKTAEQGARADQEKAKAEALRHPQQSKPQSAAGLASLAKAGYRLNEQGQMEEIPDEEKSPELKALLDGQAAAKELKQAQAALANSKNDPNSAAYRLDKARVDAALERTHQAAQALGLHEQQFANKLQEQELVKPSGQTQSRGSAARSALDVIPSLEKLTLENAKAMGPLVGRLARGEIAIGNVDPKVAELYGAMKSFYALQPAVHGFRNAEFVKDFETALGTLERKPESFLAGIKGLRPTLEAVEREGKTSHKRIVEGRDTPAPGGGEHQEGDTRTNKRTHEVQKFTNGQWQTVQPK